MTKEERLEMVLKINPPPPEPPIESESEEEQIIIPVDNPEEVKPKINPMIEKFKLSFYKIHGRYPTEDEIAASLGSLYKEDSDNNRTSFMKNTFNFETDTSSQSSPMPKEQPEIKQHEIINIDDKTEEED